MAQNDSKFTNHTTGGLVKTLILFKGGSDGGLIITDTGVRSVPPFDHKLRLMLQSAANMVKAVAVARDQSEAKKLTKVATSLCNLAVEQLEEVVGPLDPNQALIFQDQDGGFTCGSTGKPPIPLDWPPRSFPSKSDLISSGLVDPDLLDIIQRARNENVVLLDLFEKPREIAKRLGIKLSQKSAKDLMVLAPSKLDQIQDKTDREVVGFFHKVVNDGRYLHVWHERPYEVSQVLKSSLSEESLARILSGGAATALLSRRGEPTPQVIAIVAVGIFVVIVAVIVSQNRIEDVVVDRSGIEKP